ncbi:MAG: hypothetical protein JWL67_1356, partial [Solirubrobacterales bacterium]|nr:hypothetical protein [Solirubrobacterales bacterium]
ADGQYTVQGEQSSVIGEHVGKSSPLTFLIDTVPPQVSLTEPANGSSTGGDSQLARGSVGSAEHDIQRVTAQLFGGASVGDGQSPVQSIEVSAVGPSWSVTFAGLGPGTYTVRALQHDEAGNVGVSSTSTFSVTRPAASAPHPPPTASFTWFPTSPRAGENVSLVSNSTDPSSPLTAFAWDLAGTGAFATGGPTMSTTFPTAGNHVVQLRVTDALGLSNVASQTIPVGGPALPLMQPFPIVRITTTGARSGVKLRQLSVLASRGAKIIVRCRSRACPVKSQSHMASTSRARSAFVEFRRFERTLAAGVILEIRISKPGQVGKFTRFTVRRGKAPVRSDACLEGVATRPVVCPSS